MADSGDGSSQGKSGKSHSIRRHPAKDRVPAATNQRASAAGGSADAGAKRSRRSQNRLVKPLEVYRIDGIARRGLIRHVKVVGRPGEWNVYGVDGLKTSVPGRNIEEAVRRARRRFGFHPLTIRRVEADGSFGQPIALPPPAPRSPR